MSSNKEVYSRDYLNENCLLNTDPGSKNSLQTEFLEVSIKKLRKDTQEFLYELTNQDLDQGAKDLLIGQLEAYKSEVVNKVLLFQKSDMEIDTALKCYPVNKVARWESSRPYMVLPYKTRFTTQSYLDDSFRKYNDFWDLMELAGYKIGCFLTLTVDPKRLADRINGSKKAEEAWNKLRSVLIKKHKKKFDYIKVAEFTKNGWLHFHIAIFGIGYLMPHEEITELWDKYQIGKINYEYTIVFRNGDWTWMKPKTSNKKTPFGSVQGYLRKYMRKNQKDLEDSDDKLIASDLHSALMWSTNKRFFSTSRIKQTDKTEKPAFDLINDDKSNSNFYSQKRPALWIYFMSFRSMSEIPDFISSQIEPH